MLCSSGKLNDSNSMKESSMRIKPHFIIFEKENPNNSYISFEDEMKPRICLENGFSMEEYEHFQSRREEILTLIEDILMQHYFDSSHEQCFAMERTDDFPSICVFTGNYYLAYESYGVTYCDRDNNSYDIKNEQFRKVSYPYGESKEIFLPLDSNEIIKYYQLFLSVHLTGRKSDNGKEYDYMGLDLIAKLNSLEDKIEFEILSHNVI